MVSMDEIVGSLAKDDVIVRIHTVSKFDSLPPRSLPELFSRVSDDLSREVRQAAAKQIFLCPIAFERYLVDLDPQVQITVILNSVEIRRKHPDPSLVISRLTTQQFIRGAPNEVRYAIARVLTGHAQVDPPEQSRALSVEKIVPVIEFFSKELNDDLRVATSASVKEFAKLFGVDFIFEHLHGTLHRMITDSQWRVRFNAVELLLALAVVSTVDFFNQNLYQFLGIFLKDPCDQVRQFTLSGLPNLVERFGTEWLTQNLVVILQELAKSQNFLHREVYLLAVSSLIMYFPEQYRSNYAFQPMIRMLKDPVNNVVAAALVLLSEQIQEIHPFRKQYELRPIVEALAADAPPTIRDLARAFMNEFQ
jgi:hypothetical protein